MHRCSTSVLVKVFFDTTETVIQSLPSFQPWRATCSGAWYACLLPSFLFLTWKGTLASSCSRKLHQAVIAVQFMRNLSQTSYLQWKEDMPCHHVAACNLRRRFISGQSLGFMHKGSLKTQTWQTITRIWKVQLHLYGNWDGPLVPSTIHHIWSSTGHQSMDYPGWNVSPIQGMLLPRVDSYGGPSCPF